MFFTLCRPVHLWLALTVLSAAVFAQGNFCGICGKDVPELFPVYDIAGQKKMVCTACKSQTRCAVCQLPVKTNQFTELEDKRTVCKQDFNVGVFSQQDLDTILLDTRRELNRVFYRFGMEFPETNVTATLVPSDKLHQLAGVRYNPTDVRINGFTKIIFVDANGVEMDAAALAKTNPHHFEYRMYIANGLPRPRVTAICAHEYGHVWHVQNLTPERTSSLKASTREAFCELLSYQMMGAVNEPFEQAVIQANLYTSGKAGLLIAAEKDYGFNRILEWMKNGKDVELTVENLDRVRYVNSGPQNAAAADALPGFVGGKPLQIPDTLMLKAIIGSGAKKVALINNQTFATSEQAKVRVGQTNLLVQVVEIRDKSVVIRTNGITTTEEIFLQH